MRLRASDLATHLAGKLIGPDVDLDGVSIDSRTVEPGNLFVPIVAERDGHDFIEGAVAAGAGAYLTTREPQGPTTAIVVDDTAEALTGIGRFARARLDGPVVAITGSVGKTSVKDMTAAACGRNKRIHASEKSFNNELGVPLTLANAPDDTEVTIVEMGARGPNHIAKLCEIARPTIGVVTRVALAHSELFGSIEGVAAAKGELVEALPASGFAVLNADDPHVMAMADRTPATVVTYGIDNDADFRVTDITLRADLTSYFMLDGPTGSAGIPLDARGIHMVANAAAAVAAAVVTGVDIGIAAMFVGTAELSPWRMEVSTSPRGLIVINDAYNANPTSMRAALESLAALDRQHKVAIVGAMAELGVEGPAEHRAVAEEATAAGIAVIAVDAPDYGAAATHVADREAAREALADLGVGDEATAVLVKGSRVVELEHLAAELSS